MLKLQWSNTDNYYMNMGLDPGKSKFMLEEKKKEQRCCVEYISLETV